MQVLGLVDGLVHRMWAYQLPHYSTPWDVAKLSVASQLPGPLAEVGPVRLAVLRALHNG